MKINKLKEVIKSFPDDMEILAGEEGLIDVSCNYQRDFGMDRCF